MSYINKWDRIFENFKLHFPTAVEKIIDWYPSGPYEITARYSDGHRIAYDDDRETLRHLGRLPEDICRVSEDDWKAVFSRKLRRIMDRKYISQKDLSERTGISRATVSAYINGRSVPSLYAAHKIANALECSINEFMDFDE